MVVGIWVWQLPNIIAHTAKSKDEGLGGIMSVLSGTKTSVDSGLNSAQAQLDYNLKKMSQTISAQEVQAAVVADLKNKIGNKNNTPNETAPSANASVKK